MYQIFANWVLFNKGKAQTNSSIPCSRDLEALNPDDSIFSLLTT